MHRIRSKFSSEVLSRGFNAGKCKTALKLAVARIKVLKNKREAQVKQMRRELAHLLESGQDQTARIRVEHVIREEKTMSAYDLVEIYCELIVARLAIIESQKYCPIDLKEAICGVIFASPRCADIPELADVRKHFTAKFGKEFITSALEVWPDCGVDRMMIDKLSARAPDPATKMNTLTGIAQEHNIEWDSKAFVEQLHKPDAYLLNGPNAFGGGNNKMPMESYNANLPSAANQKNQPAMKSVQSDVASIPSRNTFLHGNITASSTSASLNSPYESKAQDGSAGGYKSSSFMEETASYNPSVWKMEFKDAASAAEAAAESAEMAIMAARAAIELASQGNVSGQSSTGSHRPSTYVVRGNKPAETVSSNYEDAHILHGTSAEEDELEEFTGIDPDIQSSHRDEASSRETETFPSGHASYTTRPFSRSSSGVDLHKAETNAEEDELIRFQGMNLDVQSIYNNHETFRSRPLNRSTSHSSGISLDGNGVEADVRKAGMKARFHAQRSFSEAEPADQDLEITEKEDYPQSCWWDKIECSDKSVSSHFISSAFDDDTTWGSNSEKHNDNGKGSISDSREGIFESEGQSVFWNESSAVFDDYGSDTEDFSVSAKYKCDNFFDSFSPNRSEPSGFLSTADTFSPKQSSSRLHFVTESHSVEHSETIENDFPRSKSDNSSAVFDVGLSSESENEMANPLFSSAAYRKSQEIVQKSENEIRTISCSCFLPDEQLSSRNSMTPETWISSDKDLDCYPDEEPQHLQYSNVTATEEVEIFSHSEARVTETSDEFSYESRQSLNLGRLAGGFNNKDSSTQNRPIRASVRSQQTSNMSDFSVGEPNDIHVDNSSVNLEFTDKEKNDKQANLKDNMSSLRTARTYMESDFDNDKDLSSSHISVKRGYRDKAAGYDDSVPVTFEKDHQVISASLLHANSVTEDTKSESLTYSESPRSSEQDSVHPVVLGNDCEPSALVSTKGSISRESSLNDASHVHPKLPDYDTLAAHFQSLRSNRR